MPKRYGKAKTESMKWLLVKTDVCDRRIVSIAGPAGQISVGSFNGLLFIRNVKNFAFAPKHTIS